ncbi:hypothetical protein HK405_002917, partial [Cladochytrium tenue]
SSTKASTTSFSSSSSSSSQSSSAPASSSSTKCSNSATSRNCWGDYDLNSDYYTEIPNTDVTRTYSLTLTRATMAPDGVKRPVMVINGQIPGPTISADWGDEVEVHVTNSLGNNGTSIHFHGLRQYYNNAHDGVPGITQCALAPSDTQVYRWRAEQYGMTWYHSHFSLQYGNGLFGPVVINGPKSANYDVALDPVVINDWYHDDVFRLYSINSGAPASAPSGLINGLGVYSGSGSYYQQTVTKGTRYLLRLVNSGTYTHYKFMIDGHTMTVVSNDLVAVKPYNVTVLDIGLGQRYEVVFTADQAVGNYWMRAIAQTSCTDHQNPNNLAILRYSGADTSKNPTSSAYSYTNGCGDLTMSLTPAMSSAFSPAGAVDEDEDLSLGLSQANRHVDWTLRGTSMSVDWGSPSLGLAERGAAESAYLTSDNSVFLSGGATTWGIFNINTAMGVAHPLHVHGHDFYVLAKGSGTFSGSVSSLAGKNVPRRDVVLIPASGYVVVAFPLDNPGVWLLHCHIAFHASEGLSLEFVERASDIAGAVGVDAAWNTTCANWSTYSTKNSIEVGEDSGI